MALCVLIGIHCGGVLIIHPDIHIAENLLEGLVFGLQFSHKFLGDGHVLVVGVNGGMVAGF